MPPPDEMMKRQQVLADFGEFAIRSEDLDEILTEACRLVGEALGTERAKVLEIQAGRQELLVRAGVGWASDVVGEVRIPMGERSSESYSIKAGIPVISQDIAKEDRFDVPDFMKRAGVVAMVNVPIFVPGERPYGILQVDDTKPREFGDDEIQFLRTYAMILGPVIDRLHLVEERAWARGQLEASEERFRAFVTSSSDVVYRMSPDWSEMRQLQGQSFLADTDHPSRSWMDFYIDPVDHEVVSAAIAKAIRTKTMFELEHRVRRADGSLGWTLSRAVPMLDGDSQITEWIGAAKDVTGRKEAETALRGSEERLRQFGEASQDVLWIRDAENLQWTYLTAAFESTYGMSRGEALAGNNYHSWLDLIEPEDRSRAVENIQRVRAGEQVTFEYRIRRPQDGAVRWLRNTDFPILDHAGNVVLIGGISHDLTELRETELRLQALIDGIPQLVWRADNPGLWTWASPQWTAFTGQKEADSHGWGWLEVLHPDDREVARNAWVHAVDHGRFEAEIRICAHDSEAYRWFQARAEPVRDQAGKIVEWLGTSTDIDDLRSLQERQRVLVGELQHRTFNLMGMVRSTADATIRSSASLDEFKPKFSDRIAALARVQRLLSRLDEHTRVTFDDLIRGELDAAGALQGDTDRVTLSGPEAVALRSSSVQTFAMALHELTTNAVKYGALKHAGGHLDVRWRVEAGDAGEPWLHVEWRETGVAMPAAGAVPQGTGQGRRLIEEALPYQLKARTTYVMADDGIRCSIALPVSARTSAERELAAQ